MRAGARDGGVVARLAVLLGLLAVGVVLARSFSVVSVSSTDMLPTLLPGDRVLVYTLAFRAREPERGEVVAIELAVEGSRSHPPDLRPELPRRTVFGRIIGLPGDVVEVKGRAVSLNADRLHDGRLPETTRDDSGRTLRLHLQEIGHRSFLLARDEALREPDLAATAVPPGRYLALGDLRTSAYDSRSWGTVTRAALVGRPLLVLWSHGKPGVRWGRSGHFVDP